MFKNRESKRATVHLSRTNLLTTSSCSLARARDQLNLPTRRQTMNSDAFAIKKTESRRTEAMTVTLVMMKNLKILTCSTVSKCA